MPGVLISISPDTIESGDDKGVYQVDKKGPDKWNDEKRRGRWTEFLAQSIHIGNCSRCGSQAQTDKTG